MSTYDEISALDFYATRGRFTTLAPADAVGGDIEHVVDVVQGLLVYDLVAEPFYGVTLDETQADAIHERDSAALLALVCTIDDARSRSTESRPRGSARAVTPSPA